MIGKRVQLKQSYAKWHLNHPEVYFYGGRVDPDYEEETQLHLVCCLGEPVYGRVISESCSRYSATYLVKFRVGSLTATYYVDRGNIDIPTNSTEVAE